MAWKAADSKSPPCNGFGTFECSVRHVSKILEKAYGFSNRKVPAHAPHFLDRGIQIFLK